MFENDYFVKQVDGHEDLFAFRHDFWLEGKALDNGEAEATVTEAENGDLIIEGWAANFEGLDRQGENFIPGAFQRGIKAFLENSGALCFHHQNEKGIGKVLDLKEDPEKGLWMRARVDYQEEGSPLRHIYNAVKKGSYKGLSVGGFFKRALHKGRQMIADMDFTEISVTPVAVHPKTSFAVVAGKALTENISAEKVNLPSTEDEIRDEDFWRLQEALSTIDHVLKQIERRGENKPKDNPELAVEAAL